jgi:hypothetical protein
MVKKAVKTRSKTSAKKFSWKKHLQETITEYRKFFIILLVIMGLAFSIGVVRALFVRVPCKQISDAVKNNEQKVDLNYKLK